MGFFDFLNSKPSEERLTKKLVNYVYNTIQTKKGVRVEDALCLIATIVGERCIKVSNEYSIDNHEYAPGDAVFSQKMNNLLAGDELVENWKNLPNESVFGKIRNKIEPKFDLQHFPSVESIFESYIKNIGKAEWGNLILTIPDENKPSILPLQAGYETRKYVDQNIYVENDERTLQITINALAEILITTNIAIDSSIALTMVFELINGMSKMATMTDEKMKLLQKEMNK